jgi:hypothetical protein
MDECTHVGPDASGMRHPSFGGHAGFALRGRPVILRVQL